MIRARRLADVTLARWCAGLSTLDMPAALSLTRRQRDEFVKALNTQNGG